MQFQLKIMISYFLKNFLYILFALSENLFAYHPSINRTSQLNLIMLVTSGLKLMFSILKVHDKVRFCISLAI